MTELHNPLFEEEKEFLERKKLEYERALRGDVEHIKEKSVMVGTVALVGAGLAGSIWLITKALSGKSSKKTRRFKVDEDYYRDGFDGRPDYDDHDGFDDHDDFADEDQYFTSGDGKRYQSKVYQPSARDSAAVFMAHEGDVDDLGFGASAPAPAGSHFTAPADTSDTTPHGSASAYTAPEEEDPFQDLPYDDSRRLPASDSFDSFDEYFDEGFDQEDIRQPQQPSVVGAALKSFLQSDTGKVIVAQVAAVGLAMVTKKINEFFPAAKNPDLATSPGYAPAETGFSPVASSVSLSSPDASIDPQPL